MKRIIIVFLFFNFTIFGLYCQEVDDIFSRLQGIRNSNMVIYNIDGNQIISKKVKASFSKRNISEKFIQLDISERELKFSDSLLNYKNYIVTKKIENKLGFTQIMTYYFIECDEEKIAAIVFSSNISSNLELERLMVNLIRSSLIPEKVFHNERPDSVNFVGRNIKVGKNCQWMDINNMQCSRQGQMNWGIHKTLESAQKTIEIQYLETKTNKKLKVIEDILVPVIFEGTETIAKKLVLKTKGLTSLMIAASGGKTLTIYYVAVRVRGNFVNAVMSQWDNDYIEASGLAFFLEQVMTLKN
jgi:hypothetical protein